MTTILRGNILHTPAFGQLEAVPEGYLVLEEGTVEGVFDKLPERYAAWPSSCPPSPTCTSTPLSTP